MATYTAVLGAAPAYPGVSLYRGYLGDEHQCVRAARNYLGAAPYLQANIHKAVFGAMCFQDGEPIRVAQGVERTFYLCTLTGAQDGLSDLELPMVSFHAELVAAEGETSYLQASVPDLSLAGEVRDRSNGELVVVQRRELADGSTQDGELFRGPYTGVQTQNSSNRSTMQVRASLAGYITTAQRVALESTYLRGDNGDGTWELRAAPAFEVRPGGQVEDSDGTTYTVGSVQYRAGPDTLTMQINGEPL